MILFSVFQMVIGLTFSPVTESAKMVPNTEDNINGAETSSGISLKHNNYGNKRFLKHNFE